MRRSRSARRLLALSLLVLGLGVAGCGDDDDATTTTATVSVTSAAAEPTTAASVEATDATSAASVESTEAAATTETAATDTAPADTAPADTAAAGPLVDALLIADDLPDGYAEKLYESEAQDCLGPTLDPLAAEVQPPNALAGPDGTSEVRSRAWSFASEDEAHDAFGAATGDDVVGCIVDGAEKSLEGPDYEPGGTVSDEDTQLPKPLAAQEQDAHRYLARITPKGGTEEISADSDLVVTRVDNVLIAYQFLTVGDPFDATAAAEAINASVLRAAASDDG